ncbi:dual specificity/tyrosine protein phosphatase [Baffinella frigidus]|nr:dual specificity/tyrosine protein phosphatase [Cryptophyta sp. CCMP2293]
MYRQLFPVKEGRLSFCMFENREQIQSAISARPELFYFSAWEHELYEPYCNDFGPSELGSVATFCRHVRTMMHDPRLATRHLVFYCEADTAHVTNAAFLLGAYLVAVEGLAAPDAAAPLLRIQPTPFKMFRDADFVASDFDLSIQDCLQGLESAIDAGWFAVDLSHHP